MIKTKDKNENGGLAPFLFHEGTNYEAYDYLGSHADENGYVFRVWAPHAEAVYVVGDFNGWRDETPMRRVTNAGIWEGHIAREEYTFGEFSNYKYKIITAGGEEIYKSDPYANHFETPPATSSKYYDISGFVWHDDAWLRDRKKRMCACYAEPINIYEVHLLSWKRHEDGTSYSYLELAEELPAYVKQMGYTHVEFMPVMEHPFDGSWGYQVCGYYAPTSRLGTPKDFMTLVDKLHTTGVGVILDWVPAHFPKDAHGLYEFDGEPLYEYQGADKMEHKSWGTRRFDVGRNEVESFLVSNASFWAEKYHADGLRVDAVASMIYLDYDKKPGEWLPNSEGDNRCLEAISFFRKLNSHMLNNFPDVMMIAEESTAWQNVTRFDDKNGLGFTMKWNMGWMNDLLSYAETDPYFRKYNHDRLTFSLMYAFSERYVLPISHDEVVHGKKSFLDKMPGDYDMKFAGAKAFMTYIIAHPGKKLSFMGSEIGQFREWDYQGQIEWFLLGYEKHAGLHTFVRDLNNLYLSRPELWERDDSWDGFRWIDADNKNESVLSMRRIARDGSEIIIVVNFTPIDRPRFNLGVPEAGEYKVLLCSADKKYGGDRNFTGKKVKSFICNGYRQNGLENAVEFDLAPMSGYVFVRETRGKGNRKKHKTPQK